MNIEKILRKSLDYLKSIQTLPTSGLIAGGSLANTAWALTKGTKPIVNDIDVFLLDPNLIKEKFDHQHTKVGPYVKSISIKKDDYYRYFYLVDDFMIIEKSSTKDLLNLVNYSASTEDPNLVINSFDLNCCQVGYIIETDKFIWTPEFEKFITNGVIQIVNLSTPCHTTIRYVKKCDELGVVLNDFELDLAEFCIKHSHFSDITRTRFKSKYRDMFLKYKNILGKRFKLKDHPDIEEWVKDNFGVDDKIYTLEPLTETDRSSVYGLQSTSHFLKWIRENKIDESNFHKNLWEVNFLKEDDMNIIDFTGDVSPDYIKFMNQLGRFSSESSSYLRGLTLQQQIQVVETVLTPHVNNPIFALAFLQCNTFGDHLPKIKDILAQSSLTFDEKLIQIDGLSNKLFELTKSGVFMENWRQKYIWSQTASVKWMSNQIFTEIFIRKFKIKKLLKTRDNHLVENTNLSERS